MTNLKNAVIVLVAQERARLKVAGTATAVVVLMLLCGYWAYDLLASPPVPDSKMAGTAEIANFMGHQRGLARMSLGEQARFMAELWPRFSTEQGRAELADAFARLAPSEVERVQEVFFELGKAQVLNDADQFRRLPPRQREKFVADKVAQYDQLRGQFRGAGSESFKKGLPRQSDDWTKSMVSRTSAGERAKAQPYLEAVQKFVEKEKHGGRWAAQRSGDFDGGEG